MDEKKQIQELEERITELEIRSAYQEHTIAALDKVLQEYCDLTDNLKKQLQSLEAKVDSNHLPGTVANLKDEVPPHY